MPFLCNVRGHRSVEERALMRANHIQKNAYAIPLTNSACAGGPGHSVNRQFVIGPTTSVIHVTL
jgi:hypothetical protein